MQTFLPFPDFEQSVRVLDDRRLGKQRVETLQVMGVLVAAFWDNAASQVQDREPRGWRTHPVVLMWRGHEGSLLDYQAATCRVWVERGFNDTCAGKTSGLLAASGLPSVVVLPPWFGDEALHRSHQSNLIRKDPGLYAAHFPGVPDGLPYVWPVSAIGAATP